MVPRGIGQGKKGLVAVEKHDESVEDVHEEPFRRSGERGPFPKFCVQVNKA